MLGRLVFVANSMVVVLWTQAHFNIKQIKWSCVGGPLFCFTKVQLYKHDMKWGIIAAALHMKQNSRRTERIKGSFWSSRLCVVSRWTECDTQLEPAILSAVTHHRGSLQLTSPLLVKICHYYQLMTAALLYYLVLFIFSYAAILESFGNEGSCCNHCRCFSCISGVRDAWLMMLYHCRQVGRRRRASS